MGCPQCAVVSGTWIGSICNDSVQVSRLGINEIKLLGLQYGLLFRLGTFICDVLCDVWEKSLEEPIQEDLVIKLDLTQATVPLPLTDMINDVSGGALATR